MIDEDLAELYGVTTKRLNEQVKRNTERFPEDFMFQLELNETQALRSQIATSKIGRGGRRYLPHVFTEHGVIMAANVLNSERALKVSVLVVRAFVHLRQILTSNADLARRIDELEISFNEKFKHHDQKFQTVFEAIRLLLTPDSEPSPSKRIGFGPDKLDRKKGC